VFSYIHKVYRARGITMPPSNLYSEFFTNEERFRVHSKGDKKRLLQSLREFGLELAHKAHVPEIIDIWPWFKEFYKDHDVLVLKRRHIWSHYLNILFFACVKSVAGNVPTKVTNALDEDILKSAIIENNIEFKHHDNVLTNFTKHIRFLNDVVIEELDSQVIFIEDIGRDWLEERFRVKVKNTVTPFKTLNFESYFKPKELQIVKDKFYERFDNEFKYMGYELK
jgi:hypothetical protein|tara:strand:+ start:343 stop:1014 length:672 start_codon:yes stop_codon:yes gene_type:complete